MKEAWHQTGFSSGCRHVLVPTPVLCSGPGWGRELPGLAVSPLPRPPGWPIQPCCQTESWPRSQLASGQLSLECNEGAQGLLRHGEHALKRHAVIDHLHVLWPNSCRYDGTHWPSEPAGLRPLPGLKDLDSSQQNQLKARLAELLDMEVAGVSK